MRYVLLLAAAALSGCAGMSDTECQLADWETIGYEDGVRGRDGAAIGQYRRECADAGVVPDRAAYEQGRQSGLAEYCRPSNAYRLGTAGHNYAGVCGNFDEYAFLDAYRAGRVLYDLRRDVNREEAALDRLHADIRDTEQQIVDIEKALIADETSAEDRVSLLVDLKQASQQLGELENQVFVQQQALAEAQARLADAERASAAAIW